MSAVGGAIPPVPRGSPPDRTGVRRLFGWLAPRYDSAVATYSLGQDFRWKHVLVRRLRLRSGERALDLASGTGLILERLIRVLGGSAVVGLDPSRPMLEMSRYESPGRRLVRADAEWLPFRAATFDVVTAGYLFKYVDLERFVAEVRRVLRPGGRLGGYDFSRPTTGTLPGALYGLYLRRVLPWAGRGRRGNDPGWRLLFEFLAQISDRSGWENRVGGALKNAGFVEIELVPSLGGAITWAWARAGSTPESITPPIPAAGR